MKKIFERLHGFYSKGYANRWIIFGIDLLIGLFCGGLSILLVKYFVDLPLAISSVFDVSVLLTVLISTAIGDLFSGIYRHIFRYTTLRVAWTLWLATIINVLCTGIFIGGLSPYYSGASQFKGFVLFLIFYGLLVFFGLLLFRGAMVFLIRLIKNSQNTVRTKKPRVVVYGVREISVQSASQLKSSNNYLILGFITKDNKGTNHEIDGLPIYHTDSKAKLSSLAIHKGLDGVVFPAKNDFLKEREHFIQDCESIGLATYLMPEISETHSENVARESIRRVRIEDLLLRDEIKHYQTEVRNLYRDKVIMVTGAAGSIGSELVKQIAGLGIKQLILFETAESPLHDLRLSLQHQFPELNFVPFIGDVRNRARVEEAFETYSPSIVLHAAAYKHVPLMEENPSESVLTNLLGTKNVADLAVKYGVERMVMVSTDKAVNPTNIMGACKRACEMYIQSLGQGITEGRIQGKTLFVTTRFGNVLGSQGSVIHLFRKQIAEGGPVTVTDPRITRFFMSIPEACSLVLEASTLATKPEIFVFDMGEEHKIVDLASRMIKLAGLEPDVDIKIQFTGLRPGEKLYEEVLSHEENTLPSDTDKVRIALVRDNDFEDVEKSFEQIIDRARRCETLEAVKLLKALVPEFKSMNSIYVQLDQRSNPSAE